MRSYLVHLGMCLDLEKNISTSPCYTVTLPSSVCFYITSPDYKVLLWIKFYQDGLYKNISKHVFPKRV